MDVRIGWAEFDAAPQPFNVVLGWAEFDVRSPTGDPIPPYRKNAGIQRYHAGTDKYDVLVDASVEEEEATIMAILMEISAHVL